MSVRLSKGEVNELFVRVSEDNFMYGLIFKLIYVYAKEGKLVLSLKWDDIDFENNTISFKRDTYPLLASLRDDLLLWRESFDKKYVFLVDCDFNNFFEKCVDVLRKKLRYYLSNSVKGLDVCHRVRHSGLSITDLRRLRGQHLVLDGVPLDVVMDLYSQSRGTVSQFKGFLEYGDLYYELHPCVDVDGILGDYTNLCVFDFGNRREGVLFMVSRDDLSCVVRGTGGGFVFVEGSDVLFDEVRSLDSRGLLGGLSVLGDFEYCVVDGLSFVRV